MFEKSVWYVHYMYKVSDFYHKMHITSATLLYYVTHHVNHIHFTTYEEYDGSG